MKDIDRDANKFVGAGQYNSPTNSCYGDGYFNISRERKYGKEAWEEAVREAAARRRAEEDKQ